MMTNISNKERLHPYILAGAGEIRGMIEGLDAKNTDGIEHQINNNSTFIAFRDDGGATVFMMVVAQDKGICGFIQAPRTRLPLSQFESLNSFIATNNLHSGLYA